MIDLLSVGGLIVEIMRPEPDMPLDKPYPFVGPFPSGASAITISAAARLGLKCAFVGVVGDDVFGSVVFDRLASDGVDTRGVLRSPDVMTGAAFVSYRADGGRKFVYLLDRSGVRISKGQFKFAEWGKVEWIHIHGSGLTDEAKREVIEYAVDAVRRHGGKLSFDPNVRVELAGMEMLRHLYRPFISEAELFLPNEEEIAALFGDDLDRAIRQVLAMGPKLVVIKCGSKGCLIASASERVECPGFRVQCVDPTGAGDTFDAAFIRAYSRGLTLEECGMFANAAAAMSTRRLGPMEGCPRLDEVKSFLAANGMEDLAAKV